MGRHPHQEITEAEARARHERVELYTAVLGDPARPYCFLEFSAYRSVCVEFLDGALRSVLEHSFQEKQPGKLFLSMAVVRRYDGDSLDVSSGDVYYFEVDGRLFIERYIGTVPYGSRLVGTDESTTDVTHNWEPFPEFGQYDGLAKRDRGISVLKSM
jgi:hypothetical protein